MFSRTPIVILIMAMITYTSEAWGFRLTTDFTQGFYWGSLPVQMDVVATNPSDGNQLASLLNQAANAWESATGAEIWQIKPGYSAASSTGNSIRWSNNFAAETGYDPSVTLAVTIRYATGTFFTKTEIILNGQNSSLRSNSSTLWKTILHEMGHTIGLDHSDTFAIMAPYVGSIDSIQSDDASGMNSLLDQTRYRQSIGYVSPISSGKDQNQAQFAACGSIGGLSGGSSGGGSGPSGFATSLLIGFFLLLIKKNRKNFPQGRHPFN